MLHSADCSWEWLLPRFDCRRPLPAAYTLPLSQSAQALDPTRSGHNDPGVGIARVHRDGRDAWIFAAELLSIEHISYFVLSISHPFPRRRKRAELGLTRLKVAKSIPLLSARTYALGVRWMMRTSDPTCALVPSRRGKGV